MNDKKVLHDHLAQYAPKYRVIANQLRSKIERGDHKPGEMFASEAQLVEQFGVSRATIRSALDALVKEKLLEKRQGQGSFVTERAEERYQTTLVFSYPNVSSLQHSYVGTLYNSFESEVSKWAQDNGREISVQCIRQSMSREHGHFSLLHTNDPLQANMIDPQYIRGICLTTTVPGKEIAEIQKRGIWCVVIGGSNESEFPSVYMDYPETKQAAMVHLKELGHRDIGLVITEDSLGESAGEAVVRLREWGKERGLNIGGSFNVVCGDYRRDLAYEAVMSLLQSAVRPTALVCYDDFLALGVRDAALALGMRVPGDLSIVGMGHYVPDADLTTVRTPLAQMGRAAGRMLAELVFESYDGPLQIPADDCELIVGSTSGPPVWSV